MLPTALGVVAAELLAALALTNRYRRRLPYRFWRRAHYANFAVWFLALAHGVVVGTDTDRPWAVGLYAAAAGAVSGLLAWRVLRARGSAAALLSLWPASAAVIAAEFFVAFALSPLGHHQG